MTKALFQKSSIYNGLKGHEKIFKQMQAATFEISIPPIFILVNTINGYMKIGLRYIALGFLFLVMAIPAIACTAGTTNCNVATVYVSAPKVTYDKGLGETIDLNVTVVRNLNAVSTSGPVRTVHYDIYRTLQGSAMGAAINTGQLDFTDNIKLSVKLTPNPVDDIDTLDLSNGTYIYTVSISDFKDPNTAIMTDKVNVDNSASTYITVQSKTMAVPEMPLPFALLIAFMVLFIAGRKK